jgi:restriction system protein
MQILGRISDEETCTDVEVTSATVLLAHVGNGQRLDMSRQDGAHAVHEHRLSGVLFKFPHSDGFATTGYFATVSRAAIEALDAFLGGASYEAVLVGATSIERERDLARASPEEIKIELERIRRSDELMLAETKRLLRRTDFNNSSVDQFISDAQQHCAITDPDLDLYGDGGVGMMEDVIRDIARHVEELDRNRRRLTVTGGYGTVDQSRWDQERTRFVAVILGGYQGILEFTDEFASQLIEKVINHYREDFSDLCSVSANELDPLEYESHCAQLLRTVGWEASLTKASGDQGADVVARKGRVVAVLQCKHYSQSVGNTAVQEVHAAKGIYGAHVAIVVSGADYTRSAKEAASALRVILLHHDQLHSLESLVAPSLI